MKVNIKLAQPTDFDEIIDVWEASVRATHDFLPEVNIQALKPLLLDVYLPQLQVYKFIDPSNNILGFIGVDNNKVEALFITPKSRGIGIGKSLLNYAIKTLRITDVDVNEQNTQGVGFYLHQGFVILDRSEVDGQGNPFPLLHMRLEIKNH